MNYERQDPNFEAHIPDSLQDYPDTKEEVDPNFPEPCGSVLETTTLVDSDHVHDKKTCQSLTGLIFFVGSTPVH